MLHQKIELLAPAKDLACGTSAIDHGADAVYIGGPQFGARLAAGNSLADIEQLIRHAHRFRAKVYIALNTIFDDRELALAVQLCHQLYAMGADALIIQDPGLLESELPPIPLHSSTQMDNRTPEKVRFLEEVGFRQVVLARELGLEQIREIRAATTVPLEFFVHGALCVAYSGQCYISEVVAGRSANRGACAQFCRHRFTLRDGRGEVVERDRYLLSLRDLDLSAHLGALIEAGISSFKIEGRLKDEAYVKNVTAYYRQALDRLIDADPKLQRASSGRCSFGFSPDPTRSFNRGQTEYFLTKRRARPAEIRSPKSLGRQLGPVTESRPGAFTLETAEQICNGDGLCFFDPAQGLVGIRVNRAQGKTIYPKDSLLLPVGTLVYRNKDTAFSKLLDQSGQCRTIAIRVTLEEYSEGLRLRIEDEDGLQSETCIRVAKEKARKAGTATALAERQLKKSGGTPFTLAEVRVELRPELFFPAAVFNDLRRRGFARHMEQRLLHYPVEEAAITPNTFPWPAEEVGYRDNILNRKAEAFYRRHGVAHIDRKTLRAAEVEECALMTTRYCLKAQLDRCPHINKKAVQLAEPLVISDNSGSYELGFDCRRCEMTLKAQ
ncbi:peptidase U32 family protein [Desulfogranum mediterraneum]|uniref:peptidase U32 family protein n=1 Tax=Desulfogranum mediterraneum TaxID=160661 RepID=UPI0003FB6B20|nr:U32 family peptidase [Desulfogranum mediterraneum]